MLDPAPGNRGPLKRAAPCANVPMCECAHVPPGDESPAIDPLTCEQVGIDPGTSFGQFQRHELGPVNKRPARNPPGRDHETRRATPPEATPSSPPKTPPAEGGPRLITHRLHPKGLDQ